MDLKGSLVVANLYVQRYERDGQPTRVVLDKFFASRKILSLMGRNRLELCSRDSWFLPGSVL